MRVIPRDLFNEADLLKCLGKLEILLDVPTINAEVKLRRGFEAFGFDVHQDPGDGSIFAQNVMIYVGGRYVRHRRPLNSRDPWPLYVYVDADDSEVRVFDDHGGLSDDFKKFIGYGNAS